MALPNSTTGSCLTVLTKQKPPDLCKCHKLHGDCNPKTCPEAAKAKPVWKEEKMKLSDLKNSKASGCPLCSIVYDGLLLPKVKSVWRQGGLKETDEKDIVVDFLDRRVNVRVTGPGSTAANWHHFAFYRQPGFLAASSTCVAFPIPTRLSTHTASETSLRNLRSWLEDCETHERCKRGDYSPTRVIDLGVGEDSDVRLVCNSEVQGREYTTLSYCWGKTSFVTTTTKNLEQRKECIKWSELPKTFREAIVITRALKIRYIWIDALCIIQDSLRDWEIESSRMSLVYRNSYLTIAASHATDTNGGCFTKGNDTFNASFEINPSSSVYVKTLYRDHHKEFGHTWGRERSSTPLHTRCWALQERFLSPRVAHFTSKEIVWECNTTVNCQCGCVHVMRHFKPEFSKMLLKKASTVDRTHNWIWILEVYTAQKLTNISDRLPALSGLARQAEEAGWGKYAAGLWREDLEYLASWHVVNKSNSTRHTTYLGPSWSWVSIQGAVTYPQMLQSKMRQFIKRIEISIQEFDIVTSKDQASKVIDGHILLSGRSLDASISIVPSVQEGYVFYRLITALGEVYAKFVPDYRIDLPMGTNGALTGELNIKLVPWWSYDNRVLYMVLGPARERTDDACVVPRSGAFERLGMITEAYDKNDIHGLKPMSWYSQATPFENLVFV